MNPSQRNTNAGASGKEAEAARLTNSGETHDPPTDSSFQSSSPSAPLLPSNPYNPEVTTLDPPSYESVVAQDAGDLKNRFGSSSAGNLHQANNQAPYPTGPGSALQSPYPPKAGDSSSEVPAQAPYPTGPPVAGNPPYPAGPGLDSTITSQPLHSTGLGYTPGPVSQAPYPTAPMPMPMPISGTVGTGKQIGFVKSVTSKRLDPDTMRYPPGYGRRSPHDLLGEDHQYVRNTTQQYQQPNVVHVVHKTEESNNSCTDSCLFCICCLQFCEVFLDCVKICAECAEDK